MRRMTCAAVAASLCLAGASFAQSRTGGGGGRVDGSEIQKLEADLQRLTAQLKELQARQAQPRTEAPMPRRVEPTPAPTREGDGDRSAPKGDFRGGNDRGPGGPGPRGDFRGPGGMDPRGDFRGPGGFGFSGPPKGDFRGPAPREMARGERPDAKRDFGPRGPDTARDFGFGGPPPREMARGERPDPKRDFAPRGPASGFRGPGPGGPQGRGSSNADAARRIDRIIGELEQLRRDLNSPRR